MTNHFLGLVPPSTSRLSPLETQRRRSQQSRGRSLQQRAKETQAPARGPRPDGGPAHVRPRDPRRCSGSSERPPREAPTTLSGRPGPPRRLRPPRRHGDPHLEGVARREGALPGHIGPGGPGLSRSPPKKGHGAARGVWGTSGTQKPSWEVRKPPRRLPRLRPARGLPQHSPRPRLPGETPSIGPSPKTAPAALYSLCPRSCSPLHHSCRPGAPQN